MQAVRQRFDQPEEQKKECDSDNGINSVFDQLCEVTNYGDFRNERPPKELLVHVKGRLKLHVDFWKKIGASSSGASRLFRLPSGHIYRIMSLLWNILRLFTPR